MCMDSRDSSSTPGVGPLPRYTADTYCVILCSQNCFVASNSLLSIISGVISCRLRGCASQSESHQATVYGHVFMLVRKCIFYIETAFLMNISRIKKNIMLDFPPPGLQLFPFCWGGWCLWISSFVYLPPDSLSTWRAPQCWAVGTSCWHSWLLPLLWGRSV